MPAALCILPILTVSATLLIAAEFGSRKRLIYALKPVSSFLLILTAALSFLSAAHSPLFSAAVLTGLLFCFGGDMALMFQENPRAFRAGLGLFLLGHLVYGFLFLAHADFSGSDAVIILLLLLTGAGFYRLISGGLGTMRLPVLFYMLVISFMVAAAASAAGSGSLSRLRSRLIIAGALLFYISDMLLAANRFWKPFRYHRISLAFYFSGQYCLALAASF